MLVPELDVTDLTTSLRFYVEVLEFRVVFERSAERFAYLNRDDVELMIQEAAGPGRRFRTAPLEHPCGRGVNFQLPVEDVDAVYGRAVEAGIEMVVPLEERWYQVGVVESSGRWTTTGPSEAGNRQFVLPDPDGYLWRPFKDLGVQPIGQPDDHCWGRSATAPPAPPAPPAPTPHPLPNTPPAPP
jgi:catechol 2,3-dioxygenase-like lactoylglutathione lyase family enzyme